MPNEFQKQPPGVQGNSPHPSGKAREPMRHIGHIIPKVFLGLVYCALASKDLRPDVRQYLEGLFA